MTNIEILIPKLRSMKKEIKVHLAISERDRYEPLYAFVNNKFKVWQENQTKKNFEKQFILSLIYYRQNEWLFAGIYKSISVKQINEKHYEYDTKLLDIKTELIGRLIINFPKTFRASYIHYYKYYQEFEVSELLKNRITIEPFPGYENVIVDYDYLKSIYDNEDKSWNTALNSVFGIYLIVDKKNGKNYVGSAYGKNSIWSRWNNYIKNGHGGNKKLVKLIQSKGMSYCQNYQFSILEIFSKVMSKDEIIKRESYWKKKLLSREFGYNDN
ncbi:MAG: GIY-YIG nuclease family protein [Ignavibacteria bacterium]|nr:GIY-YIG nuclease family protein [Ignavibacteria bacterium]